MKKTILLVMFFVLLITTHNVAGAHRGKQAANHSRYAFDKKIICAADIGESPAMADFAKKLVELCGNTAPKIKKKLIRDNFVPPKKISLTFKKKVCFNGDQDCYPAATIGSQILLSEEYFSKNLDDTGAVVHEIVHVIQSYPNEAPGWLREGIADYIRYQLKFTSKTSFPHCNSPEYPYFDSGYWCSAAFFGYIAREYDDDVIAQLNQSLRQNNYSDALFVTFKKKSAEQLWAECLKAECRGGAPVKQSINVAPTNLAPVDEKNLHPLFIFTDDSIRQAFNDYVPRGERNQSVVFGDQKTLNVTATDSFNPSRTENLKLTITFLPPIAQARKRGYEFGKVARGRTPEDQRAVETRAVNGIREKGGSEILFNVKLQAPGNENSVLPRINFLMVNSEGRRISPNKQPTEFTVGENDIIGAVALAENGQDLIFALKAGDLPNITESMTKMMLLVIFNGESEEAIEFQLRN